MCKAKFKCKIRDKYPTRGVYPVHLFYEYRGREYMVTDMHNGIDNLREQHLFEQRRIDKIISEQTTEVNGTEPAEVGFDMFLEYCESGDATIFDK